MKYPIYNWREIVGYATTAKQAKRIVEKAINVMPGFQVTVWMRSDDMCEIAKLPKGWVYSVPHESHQQWIKAVLRRFTLDQYPNLYWSIFSPYAAFLGDQHGSKQ